MIFKLTKQSSRRLVNPETGLSKSLSYSFIQLPSLNSSLTSDYLVRSSSSINNTKVINIDYIY